MVELKRSFLAVFLAVCIAILSLVVYVVFDEPLALMGLGVAGFAFVIWLLGEWMKSKQRPGEQVNF